MKKSVTDLQIFFLVVLTLSAYSVVRLPKEMTESAGTGAWFALLTGSLPYMASAVLVVSLGTGFPGKTLIEYSRVLVGKYLTYVIATVYTVYFSLVLAAVVRSTSEAIVANFLPKTPVPAISLLFLIAAGFGASKGIHDLGRIFTFFGLIVLPTAFLLHFIMLTQGNPTNIKPLFEPSQTLTYLRSGFTLITAYLGYETLTALRFTGKNPKKTKMTMAGAILLTAIFYIIVTESCFKVIGLDDIVNYQYPLITAIRRLDIPLLEFFKRLDLIFIVIWQMAIFCTLCITLYAMHSYAGSVIPKLAHGNRIAISTAAILLLSLVPNDIDKANELLGAVSQYLGSLAGILIPLTLFIAMKVGKHG